MKSLILSLFVVLSTITPLTMMAQDKPTCKGTTTKGVACKSTILLKDGYCTHHSPSTIRCSATTSAGKPCKVAVKQAGDKCRFHQPKPNR